MKTVTEKTSTKATKVGGADRLNKTTNKATHNGNSHAFTIAPHEAKGFAQFIGQLVDNVFEISILSQRVQDSCGGTCGNPECNEAFEADLSELRQLEAITGEFLQAAGAESAFGLHLAGSECPDCGEVRSMGHQQGQDEWSMESPSQLVH